MIDLIILFILLVFVLVILYKRFMPTIDIIKCEKGYIILLWYNKYVDEENFERKYIRLI